MLNALNPFSEHFILKGVLDFLGNILSYLNPFSENFLLKGVLDFLGNILSYLNPFSEKFILKSVIDFLGNILSYLNPFDTEHFLGYKLMQLLGDLFNTLFVPKEESFTRFSNIFQEKFSFIESIKIGINAIKNMFENVNLAPKYTLNVDCAYYKGELTIIDLQWYSQYRAYGDVVITAFVYLFFLWRVFCNIPSLFNGASSFAENSLKINEFINKGGQ